MRAKKMGRNELLSWLNRITQSDYSKIENLSDGVAYCQIMDAFFENSIDIKLLRSICNLTK
jgi:RP/EB family microtubule-associated protein